MKQYWPEGWLMETAQNMASQKSLATLAEAQARQRILEARVSLCDAAHNLIVYLGTDSCCRIRGIIPREEGAVGIEDGSVRDIALISRVNKPVCFLIDDIIETAQGESLAILSRKKAQMRCIADYLSQLIPGDVIDARVTHLEQFGAFCDIGCGISSLLPIDAISISRIFHPSNRFCTGDNIRAVVKSIDDDGRINLTHKELLGTWEENAALFSQGETVSGIVRSVEEYGAFIELMPNLAGLAEPRDDVCAGQQASVYIKNIIPEKMKIKLIIIDAFQADYAPPSPKYFYDGRHIRTWYYSPAGCTKRIVTVFE